MELRARLRHLSESERERRCGVCAVREAGPGIEAKGHPGAWDVRWIGVLTCGHIWTCPTCSEKLRRERLHRVLSAVTKGGGVWQMVTLTVRHAYDMPLRALRTGLMKAWRRCRQGGATQRIWSSRVKASVRAVEITRGANGWHPHLHVLLHTDGFDDEERETLLERWLVCVARELGAACVPSREHAIRWSTPINMCVANEVDRARYIVKLGLEVAGEKKGRKGSLSHWEVAELAAEGDAQARQWWAEFYRATKGARMVELDDRANGYTKRPDALMHALGETNVAEKLDPGEQRVVVVSVDSLELRALRDYEQRFDPGILGVLADDVRRSLEPKACVRRWLDLVTHVLGYHSKDARQKAEAQRSAQSDAQGPPGAGPQPRQEEHPPLLAAQRRD